jgi:putative transcriptional regulator
LFPRQPRPAPLAAPGITIKESMSDLGEELLEGLDQAIAHLRGEEVPGLRVRTVAIVPDEIDVAAIRAKLGMKRKPFAERFGFPIGTLTKWERGERHPDGAARAFLLVIEREPEAVMRALVQR